MSRRTSMDELYTAFGDLITKATGRQWWRKAGIQAQPTTPYATIYFTEGTGLEYDVVESIEITPAGPNEVFTQTPWGTTRLDCVIEFLRGDATDTALTAAIRLRNSLRLEERFWDVWEMAALVGTIRLTDVSAIFRADVEQRTELRFNLYANIADPAPLADIDIYDIQHQTVDINHVQQDGDVTSIPVTVDNT